MTDLGRRSDGVVNLILSLLTKGSGFESLRAHHSLEMKNARILSNRGHSSLASCCLDSLNVLGLPALGAFSHVELDGLAFLQAAEPARLDRREMHEYVLATLATDETVAFGVVKSLYCSFFCH